MAKRFLPAWARVRMGKIVVAIFLCVMVALLGLGVLHNWQYIAGQNPEGVTELYFTQPQLLPKQIQPSVDYSAQFTIANHEGRDMAYSYKVTVIENGIQQVQPPATLVVAKDAARQQPIHFKAMQPGATLQVVIELVGMNQTIHFRAQS